MSIQTTPPMSSAELAKLLGDQEEVSQFNEEFQITITTLKVPDGYQQIFTKVEDGKTTTLVRTYKDAVETEEDVEEEVEEIEVDEEQLSLMKSSVTTTTSTTETSESSSTTTKKKKSKKSKTGTTEPEGDTSVVEEPFEGGHKEITTIKFADGTYKTNTKIFYDDQHLIESKKEESSTTTEETLTKSGKKKKSKKTKDVQSNIEVIETREDENGNEVIVTREKFENGYKDTTTTKYQDGTYKSTSNITYYPVEKEIIETTEIIEKEPASIRLVERSYVTDQNLQETEEYNVESIESHEVQEKHEKVEKVKKSKKKTTVEQNSVEATENNVVEKKVVKKSKKTTDEQKAAILQRDESEGVVTVTTEKIEGGYREIRKTTFSDGSSKTEVKEHYEPVEEQVTFDSNSLKKLPKVTKKPKEVVNADGSKSTIVVEKIEGGVRETTTTIHLDGRIKTSTREYYEPKEEQIIMDEEAMKNIPKVTDKPKEIVNADGSKTTVTVEKIDGGIREITTTVHTNGRVKQSMREFYDAVEDSEESQVTEEKKRMGSIQQKREQYQSSTKTTKEEKVHTNATFQSRLRSN